jgi:predicted DNA-binding transcriptional regulator YafY
MDDLCASFEIDRDDQSKPYAYRWKSHSRGLGLPRLDEGEALVLHLARLHLDKLLPDRVIRAMDPLFEEASAQLDPASGVRPYRSWASKVEVVDQLQPLIPPALADGVFEHVTEALCADQFLDIDYRNFVGELHEGKRVMPLALVQQGARLFLVCQFEGYEDRRHLALHRIVRASCSGLSFERPPFNLRRYIEDGRFGFGYGERVQLTLEITKAIADLLGETPVSEDQRIDLGPNGRMVLTATVVRSQQLRWWIRTYGDDVRVLEPRGLLDEPVTPTPARDATNAAR